MSNRIKKSSPIKLQELAKNIQEVYMTDYDTKISISEAKKAVNIISSVILNVLENNPIEKAAVTLPGLGILRLTLHSAKKVRNLHTGGTFVVPEQYYPSFSSSASLKKKLNNRSLD